MVCKPQLVPARASDRVPIVRSLLAYRPCSGLADLVAIGHGRKVNRGPVLNRGRALGELGSRDAYRDLKLVTSSMVFDPTMAIKWC